MSIPKLLESQKKICLQFFQEEKTSSKFQRSDAFKYALDQQFRMQQQFENLQNPLFFIKNQRIQKLTSDVRQATEKLRYEVDRSVQLSKTFYRNILMRAEQTNGQKGKESDYLFARQHPSSEPVGINRQLIQKNYEDKSHQKSPLQIFKDKYDKVLHNRSMNVKFNQYYCHNRQKQENRQIENKEVEENGRILFGQDKNDYARLNQFEDSEIIRFWRPTKTQIQVAKSMNSQNNSSKLQKIFEKLQFDLIQGEYSYRQGSKSIYFDFHNNLNFQKSQQKIVETQAMRYKKSQQKQVEYILQHFLNFRIEQITCNELLNIGMRKITPWKIRSYLEYNDKRKNEQNITVDGKDMQEKYMELTQQYNLAQKKLRNQKKSRGFNNRLVSTDCQTIKEFQQNSDSMQIEGIHNQCINVCKKLEKFNKMREQAMKKKDKKQKLVFMKNVCLEIKELLFQLLLVLIRQQKFLIKQGDKSIYPMLNYRELLQLENSEEVNKKILDVVLANEQNFQITQMNGVSKKQILEIYKQEKEKNDRILRILEAKIKG